MVANHAQPQAHLPPPNGLHHLHHHPQYQQQQQQQPQPSSSRNIPPQTFPTQLPQPQLPPGYANGIMNGYNSNSSYARHDSRQDPQRTYPPPPQPNAYPQRPHHQPSYSGDYQWDKKHDPSPPTHLPQSRPHRSESSSSLNNLPSRRPSDAQPLQEPPPPSNPPSRDPAIREANDDAGGSASDFVKKLAKMLDDPSFSHVVSWGPQGDCFVVKDLTEFTKSILPRMFKHSNFASFVRQLNKYDFHKIKSDDSYGEQSWTFHHPDFQRSNRDALENIKRKVPAQRKGAAARSGGGSSAPAINGAANGAAGPSSPHGDANGSSINVPVGTDGIAASMMSGMQSQIDQLIRVNEEMASRLATMEQGHKHVLSQMVDHQRCVAIQDALMQQLITHFVQESGKPSSETLAKTIDAYGEARMTFPHLMHPPPGPAQMGYPGGIGSRSASSIDSNATLAASSPELSPAERSVLARQDSLQRLEELRRHREATSRNASAMNGMAVDMTLPPATPQSAPYLTPLNTALNPQQQQQQQQPQQQSQASDGYKEPAAVQSPRVFDAGQMSATDELPPLPPMPLPPPAAESLNDSVPKLPQQWMFNQGDEMLLDPSMVAESRPSMYLGHPSAGPGMYLEDLGNVGLLDSPGGSRMSLRKATATVSTWTVPPRVLLVDDDVVARKLFSRFLQVSGCTIDVAVDGIGAVNKMNLEKYDIVLMDIMMPKLDGVSATSLIRQFDPATPIISMTSNSGPTDIVTYYSSGMNDILPKPFTKEGLFSMLEKHLVHLKAITSIQRPTAEETHAAAVASVKLAEQQYSSMLSNLLGMNQMVDGFGFSQVMNGGPQPMDMGAGNMGIQKRMMEDPLDEQQREREAKRARFETIE